MESNQHDSNGYMPGTILQMDPLRSHPLQAVQNAQNWPTTPTPAGNYRKESATGLLEQMVTPMHQDKNQLQDQWSWPTGLNPRPPMYNLQHAIYSPQALNLPSLVEQPGYHGPPNLFPNQFEQPRMLHPDLEFRCPRIAITPSMLQTYAYMRGTNKPHGFDPLHQALYPAQNRLVFSHRVYLPHIPLNRSGEGFPKGTLFFWDPVVPVPINELPLHHELIPHVTVEDISRPLSFTYEEFIRQNPPVVGRNHYKGDRVYENFGYYRVADKWVDPESEGSLYDAYMDHSYHSDSGSIPDFQRSQLSGPRVMTMTEEDEFYQEYVEEVTDSKDGEGDPRNYHIDPATFARWASGAIPGDRYEETDLVPVARSPKLRRRKGQVRARQVDADFQFDMETGSILSGIYNPGSNPSMLESAQGVDILRPPGNLSYSCPQALIELEQAAFGAAWQDRRKRGSYEASVASTPEPFERDPTRAYQNLGIPGAIASGKAVYDSYAKNIQGAREQGDTYYDRTFHTFDEAHRIATKRVKVKREIAFLERRIPDFSTLFTATPTPEKQKKKDEHRFFSEKEADASYDEIPKQKRQYRRYFEEATERENISLAKATMVEARLESDLAEMQKDLAKLEIRKKELLKMHGVKTATEIPGLVPQRKPGSADLRAVFRSDHS